MADYLVGTIIGLHYRGEKGRRRRRRRRIYSYSMIL